MRDAAVTRIDLFTVRRAAVPLALLRMATDRLALRGRPDLRFAKLLGTGDGRTFDARDADLRRWGLLTVWATPDAAAGFARGDGPLRGWRRSSTEHWWATLETLRARGRWSGRQPFGAPAASDRPGRPAGAAGDPVAALTRARLRWRHAPRFWRAVPPVNADLTARDAVLLRIGIGEAPVGLQGTFSLWRDADALRAFAYGALPHRQVIKRSQDERWYAEELFARFAVRDHGGTIFGRDPLA